MVIDSSKKGIENTQWISDIYLLATAICFLSLS